MDLRINNNPALEYALKTSDNIILLFIASRPTVVNSPANWVYYQAVKSLYHDLQDNYGIKLNFFIGQAEQIILDITKKYNVNQILWNRIYEKNHIKSDTHIKAVLKNQGLKAITFNANLIVDPYLFYEYKQKPFLNFEKFYQAAISRRLIIPVDNNIKLNRSASFQFLSIDDYSLSDLYRSEKNTTSKNFNYLAKSWKISEKNALKTADSFIKEQLTKYESDIKEVALVSSQISTYLKYGLISARQTISMIKKHHSRYSPVDFPRFSRALMRREFCYYFFYHHRDQLIKKISLNNKSAPNPKADYYVDKVNQSQTGVPIIDACLNQLKEIAFLNHPLRVILALFLIENMKINAIQLVKLFAHNFADYDPAINYYYCCKLYDRNDQNARHPLASGIFDVISNSKIYDKNGKYIRYWVKRLVRCPDDEIYLPADPAKYKYFKAVVNIKR